MSARKGNIQLIAEPECPETCDLETQLAHALRSVLDWPNPKGKICEYYIPGWLATLAQEALDRFYSDHEN